MWIAFIFQYLWDTKQLFSFAHSGFSCCELLSFFSIFGIQNNYRKSNWCAESVVNCFHFSVSLGYKTTAVIAQTLRRALWIAFIFQYLWDTKQLQFYTPDWTNRCELLSFFSIFGIQNNFVLIKLSSQLVVNCFHFSVSLGYKTTINTLTYILLQLWIAFIFQYLWDTKQLRYHYDRGLLCCELLSFFSIFGIQNNILLHLSIIMVVVNCFHFSVSLGYKTTISLFTK